MQHPVACIACEFDFLSSHVSLSSIFTVFVVTARKLRDRVLLGKWSGTEVKIDGEELLIMKESDIMGIIDEPVSKRKAA
jgi:hypothetical protein